VLRWETSFLFIRRTADLAWFIFSILVFVALKLIAMPMTRVEAKTKIYGISCLVKKIADDVC